MAQSVIDTDTDPKPLETSRLTKSQEIDKQMPVELGGDDTILRKKPLAFYLAILGININVFLFSLDATTLAVAIPVSFDSPALSTIFYCSPSRST
jgi:hypothetical protein